MRMEAVEGWTRVTASPQALVPEAEGACELPGKRKPGHLEPSEGPRGESFEEGRESLETGERWGSQRVSSWVGELRGK